MSQKIFASYMGVSDKTVEAWEAGTNHPSRAASRLLSIIEKDKELIYQKRHSGLLLNAFLLI